MCPGSKRKWVRVREMPCFSESGHYRGSTETEKEKFKQTKRPVLAALHRITVAPFDPSDFYGFRLFFSVFFCLACAYFCLSFQSFHFVYSLRLFSHLLSYFLQSHPILISSHLQSTASILDYLMSCWGGTESGKYFILSVIFVLRKEGSRGL